jgi:hypothetical protein
MIKQNEIPINRRASEVGGKLKGKGMVYFNGKKMPVELKDSRSGGIGIEISQRKLERLQLQKDDIIKLEFIISNGNHEKIEFIVKHITPMDDNKITKYKIGLQYADKSTLTEMQRNIQASNQIN